MEKIRAFKSTTLDEACVVFSTSRSKAKYAIWKCLDACFFGATFASVGSVTRDKSLDGHAAKFKENYCYRRDYVERNIR